MKRVSCIRDLGIHYDHQVTFNGHIEIISNRAIKLLGFIKRNLKVFNVMCLKTVYVSFERSILENKFRCLDSLL